MHTKASDAQGEILIMLEQAPWLGHRVLLTRLESGLQQRPCGSERGHCYRSDVDDAFDQIPVEHLTPNLAWAATRLCQHGELQVISRLPTHLDAISNSTASPILRRPRADEHRLRRLGPQEANRARQAVSVEHLPPNWQEPGRLQADRLHSDGVSVKQERVKTLQLLRVVARWSGPAAGAESHLRSQSRIPGHPTETASHERSACCARLAGTGFRRGERKGFAPTGVRRP